MIRCFFWLREGIYDCSVVYGMVDFNDGKVKGRDNSFSLFEGEFLNCFCMSGLNL